MNKISHNTVLYNLIKLRHLVRKFNIRKTSGNSREIGNFFLFL